MKFNSEYWKGADHSNAPFHTVTKNVSVSSFKINIIGVNSVEFNQLSRLTHDSVKT
jgi:hypothetical protein